MSAVPQHPAANDPDSLETQEWLDALEAVLENEGVDRAHYLAYKGMAAAAAPMSLPLTRFMASPCSVATKNCPSLEADVPMPQNRAMGNAACASTTMASARS